MDIVSFGIGICVAVLIYCLMALVFVLTDWLDR